MQHPVRPNCDQILPNGNTCGNPAALVRNNLNGTKNWRRTNNVWTCHYCHSRLTTNYKPHMDYTRYKKTYCENIDGRLGKVCTANITHPKELTVDHIDSDHDNDDPGNLQTLCAACHNLKTHQDYANKGTSGVRELVGTAIEDRHPHLFGVT